MSGRNHDVREVQIPLQQAPPPQHRPTNHWPPSEAPPPSGGALLPVLGGFRERFLLPPDNKYRCEKCRLVLVQPRQTECGHRFCNSCIGDLLSRPNPMCPADREPLFPDKIFRDICCQREILALKVFCRSEANGCKEQLTLQQLPDHLTVCPFLEVPCPLGRCKERMMRKDVPEHLNRKCKHRETSCDFCFCKMPLTDVQKHKETDCPKFPVSCPNLCSSGPLPRSELHVHQGECPKAQANCPFHRYGCSFKGLKEELKLHESTFLSEHLRMMSSRSSTFESKVDDLRAELSERFQILPGLSGRLSETEAHSEDLKERSRQSEQKLSTVQKLLSAHSEKLLELEMELRSVRLVREEVETIRTSVETLRTRITALEQTRTGSGTSHALVTLETQLGRHDDVLSVHEIRLADMDLRFQVLETASYNGTLIWKIRDYARRKQEAVSGKTLSLYSQPFYTSYFGYKMCARVYLNGDGMGKGTHLSLFFVVMRGEYDALLHWPFKQKLLRLSHRATPSLDITTTLKQQSPLSSPVHSSRIPSQTFLQFRSRKQYSISLVRSRPPGHRHDNNIRLRHLRTRHMTQYNLLPVPTSTTWISQQKTALFNTRSLNKRLLLNEFISDNKLDLLCLTETWHKPMDDIGLNQITWRRGGGLAVIHPSDIALRPISIPALSSFEHLAFRLPGSQSLTSAVIYRPPKSCPSFLSDFSDFVTQLCPISIHTAPW